MNQSQALDFLPALSYTHADPILAQKVYNDRYALHDEETGQQLEFTWAQTAARVAKAIAVPSPQDEERFLELLTQMRLIPGGRVIAGAGLRQGRATLSNCFVVPIQDSRRGILEATAQAMEILSKGGGVGINFNPLRESGAMLHSSRGHASGPNSFISAVNGFAHTIEQGGSRRAAMMGQLHVSHPNIRDFIHWKQQHPPSYELVGRTLALLKDGENLRDDQVLAIQALAAVLEQQTNLEAWEHFNVSVQISDSFMHEVRAGIPGAVALWDEIAQQAWASGDPGLFFIDRANNTSNTGHLRPILCTNPCGEIPLDAFGTCNLASLNLKAYLRKNGHRFELDYGQLAQDVRTTVRFLDNVLLVNYWPIPETAEANAASRRQGIGTMGLADVLVELGLPYGSPGSQQFADDLYQFMAIHAYDASVDLSIERGPYELWNTSILDRPFIQKLKETTPTLYARIARHGLRNSHLLTQAPTGTTSMLAGVSSGIEPHFDRGWKRFDRVHPEGVTIVSDYAFHPAMRIAPEVSVLEHILVQAAAQRWIDQSVSKTINLPNSATVADVKQAYWLSYDYGCKGVTVFRDGCRGGVLRPLTQDELLAAMMSNCPTGTCEL